MWVAEISERRARKAERIIRRLARLTFHQLAQAPLRWEEAAILKAWESDCARLLGRLDHSAAGPSSVIQSLLLRFAQSLERRLVPAVSGGTQRGGCRHPPPTGLQIGQCACRQLGVTRA